MQAAQLFLSPDAEPPHLVLCRVASEDRLLAAADHLFRHDIRFTLFREPDYRNQATALATQPLRDEHRSLLARYRCLTREDLVAAPCEGPFS
jgi:hypothetical protein